MRHTTKGKQILLKLSCDGRGRKALDLGCREQFWTRKLQANGYEVVSADLAPQHDRVSRMDANEALPFPDETFDLVWCTEVIEHVMKPEFALSEIQRVMKAGGKLLLATPNSWFWVERMFRLFGKGPADMQNDDHKHFFHYDDLKRLVPEGHQYGYFPSLFYRKTLRSRFSLLSPTIIVERVRSKHKESARHATVH